MQFSPSHNASITSANVKIASLKDLPNADEGQPAVERRQPCRHGNSLEERDHVYNIRYGPRSIVARLEQSAKEHLGGG